MIYRQTNSSGHCCNSVINRRDKKGSHIRLTTTPNGEHHVTILYHQSLRVGSLASILDDVADHFQLTHDELLQQLLHLR